MMGGFEEVYNLRSRRHDAMTFLEGDRGKMVDT